MSYRVAVVGATGSVGREMLNILAERDFPCKETFAIASPRSAGREISFGELGTLKVQSLEEFDFTNVDIALFAAGGSVAEAYVPRAVDAGSVVIDNSSHFRMEPDVPLVVPEVNGKSIAKYTKRRIIANPNCSTAQLVVALKPLHDAARIKRAVISTYQSVSGVGNNGMDELFNQTKGIFVNDSVTPVAFTKQIAFNVIPHIDTFLDDGSTREEWKMVSETRKILDSSIDLTVTCVRVPVFIGHSESVNLSFAKPIDMEQAQTILRSAPGVIVVDKHEDGGYITPVDCVGDYATYVSRIRNDPTIKHGLNLWVVSDNLRKGAALNAVQIAEILVSRFLRGAD